MVGIVGALQIRFIQIYSDKRFTYSRHGVAEGAAGCVKSVLLTLRKLNINENNNK